MIRGEYKGEGENSERGGGLGGRFLLRFGNILRSLNNFTSFILYSFFYMFSYLIRMNCPMNS